MSEQARAVFVDRDGVLNRELGGYVTRPEELELLPGVADALARLHRAGWPVIVFTNQAGIGRGRFTAETLELIHAKLKAEIAVAGGEIRAIYFCPHHPDDGCECRKPMPGMLLQAAQEHHLDLAQCYAIGDTPRDIQAGHEAGCRTVLVLTGHTHIFDASDFPLPHPDSVFPDLAAAVDALVDLPHQMSACEKPLS